MAAEAGPFKDGVGILSYLLLGGYVLGTNNEYQ